MHIRPGAAMRALLVTIGALAALAACNSNSGLPRAASPTPTPTNAVTFSVAAGGSTVTLPNVVSGSLQFPSATAGVGSTFTVAINGVAPTPLPPYSANTPLMYMTFTPSVTTTFSGFPALTINLPSSITPSGSQFFLAVYNGTAWQNNYAGPANVNGQTLTFNTGSTPVTYSAGSSTTYVLYSAPAGGSTPTPPPPTLNMYVTNAAAGPNRNSILIFPYNSSGNVPSTGAIAGVATGLNAPLGLSFDNLGNLLVANSGGNSIEKFAANASGNVAPAATITAATLIAPSYVAADASNNVYNTQPNNTINEFAANANGASTPLKTITGSNTLLNNPAGIAMDSSGNIYVADSGANAVLIFAPGSNGNVAPAGVISGSNTGLSTPTGLSLDTSGNVYVANAGNNSIVVFTAAKSGVLNGNLAPAQTVSGSATLLNNPQELFIDIRGNMYVADNGANAILEWPTSANGNVLPNQNLSGSSTGLAQPFGVAAR